MKRFLILILVLVGTPVFALTDWQSQSIERESANDRENLICFKDADGKLFFVDDGINISDEEAALVIKLKDIFYGWESIKIKEVRFSFEGSVLNAVIIPAEMKWDDFNLLPYLPAGMQFVYQNESLQYNFRIKKDTYFLRVSGAYISEKVFCDKITEAIKTPQIFVQRRDPDYLLSQIDRINLESENLKKTIIRLHNGSTIDPLLVEKVVSLKKQNPQMTSKQIDEELRKEKIKLSISAIDLIIGVYFNEFKK
jgi:hypothetical protein